MTFPQIILLGHGSWVTSERGKSKVEADKKTNAVKQKRDDDDPIVFKNKRLSELSSHEMSIYYGGFGTEDFG